MIALIENAILNRLRNASFGYRPTIESYGGELDDQTFEWVRKFPAMWVVFSGGGKPKMLSQNKWKAPANFVVMVAARNVRGERQTRHGSINEVGAYQMLQDVCDSLIGQSLGLAIDPLNPGAQRTLFNSQTGGHSIAVFAHEFHTNYVLTLPRTAIDPTDPDFLRVGIDYFLKPGDDVVDASDQITLTS